MGFFNPLVNEIPLNLLFFFLSLTHKKNWAETTDFISQYYQNALFKKKKKEKKPHTTNNNKTKPIKHTPVRTDTFSAF